jgi:hypothetical protein
MLMVLSNLTCQFSKKSEKMAYTFNEYVDMLICLGASNDNASDAAREYARLPSTTSSRCYGNKIDAAIKRKRPNNAYNFYKMTFKFCLKICRLQF